MTSVTMGEAGERKQARGRTRREEAEVEVESWSSRRKGEVGEVGASCGAAVAIE